MSPLFDPSSVVGRKFANGLTVLLRRDTSAPVVAIVTHVNAGYFDETDDVVGIAHVLEHMFFKGTPTRGVGEIARETKASGGYLNAHTIYDHTAYVAVLPKDGFQRGLEIQADAYANSLIDSGELAKELEVIIQEAKRKEDSPGAVAIETLYELLHDRHRIRRWRIGREEGLRALTREKVLAFYRNFYRPRETILVLVGDLEVTATIDRVEALYGSLEDGAVTRVPGGREDGTSGFRYRELAADIGQTQVAFGWRTPGALHADTVALDLLALVLASGRASRLYRAVRERQFAATVSADNYTPAELGVFTVHCGGPPEHASDAAATVWRELRAVREDGVTDGEMERALRLFESGWLRGLETMEGQASFLATWESLGDWRLSTEYYERAMAATAGELTGAARRYLTGGEASLLVCRPRSSASLAGEAHAAQRVLQAAPLPAVGAAAAPLRSAKRVGDLPPVEREGVTGEVHVYRTSRGVPVLVRRRAGSLMAHIGVYSGVGAAREPESLAGLATVAARAALKGTEHRSADEIASESELLGGSIAAAVTSDGLAWTLSVPATRIAHAVELLADVVQRPRFATDVIETERAVALANLAELRDDMYRYPLRLATAAAYDKHPYGRGHLGTVDTLNSVGAGAAREWHAEQVVTGPVAVAFVGDMDEAEVARVLARAFDDLVAKSTPAIASPTWPPTATEAVELREKKQTALALLFRAPSRRDSTRFVAHLIAGVASGLGGRFFEVLREQRSLAYTVHAYPVERVAAGAFVAYIATSPEREEAAREALLREFARLRETPVTADELERAKTYALGSYAIATQTGGAVLREIVDAWLYGTGLEELAQFESRVRAVTADAMLDLARQYFDADRRVEGIVRGQT